MCNEEAEAEGTFLHQLHSHYIHFLHKKIKNF